MDRAQAYIYVQRCTPIALFVIAACPIYDVTFMNIIKCDCYLKGATSIQINMIYMLLVTVFICAFVLAQVRVNLHLLNVKVNNLKFPNLCIRKVLSLADCINLWSHVLYICRLDPPTPPDHVTKATVCRLHFRFDYFAFI